MELIAEGFTAPVTIVEAPDGSGRLFVVDQIVNCRFTFNFQNLLTARTSRRPVPLLEINAIYGAGFGRFWGFRSNKGTFAEMTSF
ncbi:MAG: hypothetical protein ACM339_05365, partial [Ignavibacteria bacterium]